MISTLRDPRVFRLWIGQALSSIGDEIYRVGLTWLAVGLIGADTGYLSAAQAASLMVMSFVGGHWADRWDAVSTMVKVDLARAVIVLLPVVVSFFCPLPLWLLVVVAIVLSGLGAFFDPALQTMLPRLLSDVTVLRSATGVMATTTRLARMVGPALVGVLTEIVPAVHFFTLDALSFGISAGSVRLLRRDVPADGVPGEIKRERLTFWRSLVVGFTAVEKARGMRFVLWAKCIAGSAWTLAFTLGMALLVQEFAPGDTAKFGLTVAAYGAGNFGGAVYFGSHKRPQSGLMMFSGFLLLGVGFLAIAGAASLTTVAIAAAFSGFTGPMSELTFSDLLQARFNTRDIARVFRLRLALETSATLVCMLASPTLFRLLSVRGVIGLCGAIWVVVGALGLVFFRRQVDGPAEAAPSSRDVTRGESSSAGPRGGPGEPAARRPRPLFGRGRSAS